MTDTITIVRARNRRLAKFIGAAGNVASYEGAKHFDAAGVPVRDLQHLATILRALLGRPDCAVIRGSPIGGDRVQGMRRLLHGGAPTIQRQPHRWLGIDIDGTDRPKGVEACDLAACAEAAVETLPPAFHSAECIAVATGSHGVKPGIRMRLWYWLTRQMDTAELKAWLSSSPADPALFGAAQLIYTAAPVFAAGRADHLPSRLVALPGEQFVEPPPASELLRPTPPPLPLAVMPPAASRGRTEAYITGALVRAVEAVLSAGEGRRHATLVAQTCALARYVRAGLLTASEVDACLSKAAAQAGKSDATEVTAAIAWGLANPSAAPISEGARDAA